MNVPLIVSIGTAVGLAAIGGLLTPIGPWYANLKKPRWNPPNWAFGPAWTVILGLWAWAGYISWEAATGPVEQRAVLILFGVNALCHLLWSPLFFKFRRPDWAAVEVVFLWASILAMLILLRPISAKASWLLVPYFVWVSFAACLNFAIVRLNAPIARARTAGTT